MPPLVKHQRFGYNKDINIRRTKMSEYQYGASEPMLLYCTDEYGDPVCFELIAQLTHDDGNEYALLGIKDDALGGPLSSPLSPPWWSNWGRTAPTP